MFGSGVAHHVPHPSTSTDAENFERSIAADLRHAVARYPQDAQLAALVKNLAATSTRFAELWSDSTPAVHTSSRKTIVHPVVGDITLDCDVLSVPGADLHLVTYTAAAGSEEETKLDLIRVTNGIATV
jgi:MmyB-like transcription regulator ligand binding domain